MDGCKNSDMRLAYVPDWRQVRQKRVLLVGKFVVAAGHKSDAMLSQYIRDSQLFVDNAAGSVI